jgi:nitric oxide reductase activation protein
LCVGHLAEGNYNCTSLGAQEEPLRQVDMEDDMQKLDDVVLVDQNDDREAADASVKNIDLLASREEEAEGSSAARLQQERRKKDAQEEKRPKKSTRVENMMEKYLEMRTKQAEDESAQLAKEKEHTQGVDFSIKKCISSMKVTKEEKAKAYVVFKTPVNRELFLCACEDDLKSALIWLKNEMP